MAGASCAAAQIVTAMLVYVSASMSHDVSEELRPGKGEPPRSEPLRRRTGLRKRSGADRDTLLSVGLEPGCKRPCKRTVSLRAKGDDRRHPMWNAPALIAGQMLNLDVAINPGGAVRLT